MTLHLLGQLHSEGLGQQTSSSRPLKETQKRSAAYESFGLSLQRRIITYRRPCVTGLECLQPKRQLMSGRSGQELLPLRHISSTIITKMADDVTAHLTLQQRRQLSLRTATLICTETVESRQQRLQCEHRRITVRQRTATHTDPVQYRVDVCRRGRLRLCATSHQHYRDQRTT